MPRLFDFGGREVDRIVTVAGLRALKGRGERVAQVTADTADEARAAEAAGIEMAVCRASNIAAVRKGSSRLFLTAALGFAEAVTDEEMLRSAFSAVNAGADAVITGRSPRSVEALAREDIPVVAHVGFVPRKSTWIGGIRAVGRTEAEARRLTERLASLESAGAFAAECELISAPLMSEINRRTSLVTISLGSGPDADVTFLFTSDICGQSERLPRHARAWGDLKPLVEAVNAERVRALGRFREAVASGDYPQAGEMSPTPGADLSELAPDLDRLGGDRS